MTQPTAESIPQTLRLLEIVRRLRAPDGCPWDREQTLESMAPHLLEEAFEAVDAIRKGLHREACEELGDVLMNVLMLSRIAHEDQRFDHEDVARTVADKLVRRHPHVFGPEAAGTGGGGKSAEQVLTDWEAIKRAEAAERATADGTEERPRSVLDGVPDALPALQRAQRVGEKAARTGFDWPDADGPRRKLDEELDELDEAIAGGEPSAVEDELGDVLFSAVNLARHHGVHAETALQRTIDKFRARFAAVEHELGERLGAAGLDELEAAWQRAKKGDRAAGDTD